MHATVYIILLSLCSALALTGCSTSYSPAELSVISHYQSASSYGSVFIDAEELEELRTLTVEYSSSRGVEIAEQSQSSSQIVIEKISGTDDARASVWRAGELIDQVMFEHTSTSSQQYEQLAIYIIDELLLTWHSPASSKLKEIDMPEFYLRPTSYEIRKSSFGDLFSESTDDINNAHQAWYNLPTLSPTFSWDQFPRDWDMGSTYRSQDFEDVRYEFRIWDITQENMFNEILRITDLEKPQIEIAQGLPACRELVWSVRATFNLNGVPRQTEWAGYYPTKVMLGPWVSRRNIRSASKALEVIVFANRSKLHDSSLYYTVRTPQSPFGEACDY